jgi:hypothetical protein
MTDVETVLRLAERGFYVFPVNGKVPTVAWKTEATRDVKQIVAWFAGTSLSVGIACGASRLLVVDEDTIDELARCAG